MLKSPFKAEGLNLYKLFQKISKGDYLPLPNQYSKELVELAYAMLNLDPTLRPSLEEVTQVATHYKEMTNAGIRPRQDDDGDERPYFGDMEFDYIKNDYHENRAKQYGESKMDKDNNGNNNNSAKKVPDEGKSDNVTINNTRAHDDDDDKRTSSNNNRAINKQSSSSGGGGEGSRKVSENKNTDQPNSLIATPERITYVSRNSSLKEQVEDGADGDSEGDDEEVPVPPPPVRPMSHRKQYSKKDMDGNEVSSSPATSPTAAATATTVAVAVAVADNNNIVDHEETPYSTHRKSVQDMDFENVKQSGKGEMEYSGVRGPSNRKQAIVDSKTSSSSSSNRPDNNSLPTSSLSSKSSIKSNPKNTMSSRSISDNINSNNNSFQNNGENATLDNNNNNNNNSGVKGSDVAAMELLWHKLDMLGYFNFRRGFRDNCAPTTPLEMISPFSPRAPKRVPPLLITHFAFEAKLSRPWIASQQQQFLDFVHVCHWSLNVLGYAKE
jgi:hypothetical protein